MKLLGQALKMVGDITYAINARSDGKKPYRYEWLESVTDFLYRHSRKLGARQEWK